MRRIILTLLLLLITQIVNAQHSQIPKWFIDEFSKDLNKRYTLSAFIHPTFLEFDFNGDTFIDIAALVTENKNHKKGILLINGKTRQSYLFGAGIKFGSGSDNFSWLKQWSIYKNKTAYKSRFNTDDDLVGSKKVKLHHQGILVTDLEDGAPTAGGIIYWNGQKFIWIHQGE